MRYRLPAFVAVVLMVGILFSMAFHHQYPELLTGPHTMHEENHRLPNLTQMTGKVRGHSEADWDKRFEFLPHHVQDCHKLFNGDSRLPGNVAKKLEEHKMFVADVSRHLEGYTAKYTTAYKAYLELAAHPSVNTICETGFNAGHSTLGWLLVNPRAHVYSFDIGIHTYARSIAKHLMEQFPGRLTLTWGDSTKTLREFRAANPTVQCDLIIIDGGHTTKVCQADFDNFRMMASRDNVVILDNYPQPGTPAMRELGLVWEPARRDQLVVEVFRCVWRDNKNTFGFSVGRFVVPSQIIK